MMPSCARSQRDAGIVPVKLLWSRYLQKGINQDGRLSPFTYKIRNCVKSPSVLGMLPVKLLKDNVLFGEK